MCWIRCFFVKYPIIILNQCLQNSTCWNNVCSIIFQNFCYILSGVISFSNLQKVITFSPCSIHFALLLHIIPLILFWWNLSNSFSLSSNIWRSCSRLFDLFAFKQFLIFCTSFNRVLSLLQLCLCVHDENCMAWPRKAHSPLWMPHCFLTLCPRVPAILTIFFRARAYSVL